MTLLATVVDCEAFRAGWPRQPVNSLSSLAFVAVGLWLLVSGRSVGERVLGVGAGLTGFGSVLFHADGGTAAGFLHDWSIVVLIAGIYGLTLRTHGAAVAVVASVAALSAAIIGAWEESAVWLGAAAAVGTALRVLAILPGLAREWALGAVAFAALGGLLFFGGRTGGFWCEPDSVFQAHGGWHLAAAVAVAVFVAAIRRRPAPDGESPA